MNYQVYNTAFLEGKSQPLLKIYLHADTLSKLILITTVSPLGLEMEDFNHNYKR